MLTGVALFDSNSSSCRELAAGAELAIVVWLIIVFACEALVAVAGAKLGVSSGRAVLAAVDVGRARDGEGVLRAELTFVVWLVVIFSCQTLLAVAGAGLRMTTILTGSAV